MASWTKKESCSASSSQLAANSSNSPAFKKKERGDIKVLVRCADRDQFSFSSPDRSVELETSLRFPQNSSWTSVAVPNVRFLPLFRFKPTKPGKTSGSEPSSEANRAVSDFRGEWQPRRLNKGLLRNPGDDEEAGKRKVCGSRPVGPQRQVRSSGSVWEHKGGKWLH